MILAFLLGCPLVTEGDLAEIRDADGDGVTSEQFGGRDCDDTDPAVFPGAENVWYTGVREDCAEGSDFDQDGDGLEVDEDCDDTDPAATTPAVWFPDQDGDGLGNPAFSLDSCTPPDGAVADAGDCDDNDRTIGSSIEFFRDADGDGFGDPTNRQAACEPPVGFVFDDTDCDDGDPDAHPGALWHFDDDGDGFGDPQTATGSCLRPAQGWIADGTDCDDTDRDVHPGASGEVWKDGIDTDCAGDTDLDADADGMPDIPGCAPGSLIRVPADQPDLQSAVDTAAACDAIEVDDSQDWGRVFVDKPLAIFAAPHTRPRLLAAPIDEIGVRIERDLSVVLEGLVIEGFDLGVEVTSGAELLAADLELREGTGIAGATTSRLELYDLVVRDGAAALDHRGQDLVLHRCEIAGALASSDVLRAGDGPVEIRDCTIRDSAAGAGAVLRADADAVLLEGLRLENNLGVALDLSTPLFLGDPVLQLTRVTLLQNISTAPFLVRVSGQRLGALQVQDLVVRDNVWDLAPGGAAAGIRDEALFLVDGITTVMERAVFRGNQMNREGAQLHVTGGAVLGVQLDVRATEISGDQGTGVRMDGGQLRNVTLVGLGTAIESDGAVTVTDSILCNNGDANVGSLTVTDTLFWNNGSGPVVPGAGNDNGDPQFVRYHPNLPHDLWDLRVLPSSAAWLDDLGAYAGPHADPDATRDGDGDGMFDTWEDEWVGGDAPPGRDDDYDSLDNLAEFQRGTLPTVPNTDGDALDDAADACPLDPQGTTEPCAAWVPGTPSGS